MGQVHAVHARIPFRQRRVYARGRNIGGCEGEQRFPSKRKGDGASPRPRSKEASQE